MAVTSGRPSHNQCGAGRVTTQVINMAHHDVRVSQFQGRQTRRMATLSENVLIVEHKQLFSIHVAHFCNGYKYYVTN